jgi:hypothetical protein
VIGGHVTHIGNPLDGPRENLIPIAQLLESPSAKPHSPSAPAIADHYAISPTRINPSGVARSV